jgi:hypothetical protein
MEEFFVGGYVPATNIQLPFWASILVDAVLFILVAFIWHKYNKQIKGLSDKLFAVLDNLNYLIRPSELLTDHKASALPVSIAASYSRHLEQVRQALKNSRPDDSSSHQ